MEETDRLLIQKLQAQNKIMLEALQEIAKGQGAFSRDPLEHASNTIDNMKEIANEAIKNTTI